jgi:hypothetical protein
MRIKVTIDLTDTDAAIIKADLARACAAGLYHDEPPPTWERWAAATVPVAMRKELERMAAKQGAATCPES